MKKNSRSYNIILSVILLFGLIAACCLVVDCKITVQEGLENSNEAFIDIDNCTSGSSCYNVLVEAEQKDKLIENEISKMDEALKKIMKQMQASGKKHSAATRNRANSADLSKATKEKEEEETSTPSGL